MPANPIGKGFFRHSAIGQGQDLGNDLSVRRRKVVVIHAKECDHGQESDTLVAVAVRVVLDESERVGRREHRHVGTLGVVPLLLRPSQCSYEDILVPNPGPPSMLSQLVVVDGVDDDTAEPSGLETALGHRLLGQLSQRVPILLRRLGRHSQRPLGVRIVGCQENPAVGLHGQDTVASLEVQAVGHVLGQRGAHRAAGLAQGHFLGHVNRVAY